MEIHKSAHIPAAADEMWGLIIDWAGMLRWWLAAEDGGLGGPRLVACELVGADDEVPRTRRMSLENGVVTEEQLFYQNDQARRIYYSKLPDRDITGYVASTYVDEIDSRTCVVHITSQFDVRSGADSPAARARFEAVYAAMFRGFQRYFSPTPAE
jgi:Polyketide cyclase / dehydrase and lipid transport